MVVEILLQLLVGEVDTQLLKVIELRKEMNNISVVRASQAGPEWKLLDLDWMSLSVSPLYLKDLEAGDVEDSDEVLTRQSGV